MNHTLCGLREKNNFLINIYILRLVSGLGRIQYCIPNNLLDFTQKVHLLKNALKQTLSGNTGYLHEMVWILIYTLCAWKNNGALP